MAEELVSVGGDGIFKSYGSSSGRSISIAKRETIWKHLKQSSSLFP